MDTRENTLVLQYMKYEKVLEVCTMSKRKNAKQAGKNKDSYSTACCMDKAAKDCERSYGPSDVNGINKYDAEMCGRDNVKGDS